MQTDLLKSNHRDVGNDGDAIGRHRYDGRRIVCRSNGRNDGARRDDGCRGHDGARRDDGCRRDRCYDGTHYDSLTEQSGSTRRVSNHCRHNGLYGRNINGVLGAGLVSADKHQASCSRDTYSDSSEMKHKTVLQVRCFRCSRIMVASRCQVDESLAGNLAMSYSSRSNPRRPHFFAFD